MRITKTHIRKTREYLEKHGWVNNGSGIGAHCILQAFRNVNDTSWDCFSSFLCGLRLKNGPQVYHMESNSAWSRLAWSRTANWNDDPKRTWKHVRDLLLYAEQQAPSR